MSIFYQDNNILRDVTKLASSGGGDFEHKNM